MGVNFQSRIDANAGIRLPAGAAAGKVWVSDANGDGAWTTIAAGGDLTGNYPNPTIASDAVTAAKMKGFGALVSSLPASPGEGEICFFQSSAMATANTVWMLRYHDVESYQTSVTTDSPLLYWRLGDSGSTAADTSGNSRTGTYTGSPSQVTGALTRDSDQGHDFDGSTQYAESASYNPVAAGANRTFEAWVNRDTNGTNDAIMGGGVASGGTLLIRLQSGADTLNFYPQASAAASWTSVGIGTGGWHHVVVTFDNTNDSATLWVDGVNLGAKSITDDFLGSTQTLMVGAWRQVVTVKDFFDGKIDEVAVYSGILSDARILAHYYAGRKLFWNAMGPPLYSAVAASETTASTTYTALATSGPSITLPLDGAYVLRFGATTYDTTINTATFMSFDRGTALAAADATAIQHNEGAAGTGTTQVEAAARSVLITANPSAAQALAAKYRATGGTGTWLNRWMEATPRNVG